MSTDLNSILPHAQQTFQTELTNPVPISGGWLNQKWRADSSAGPVLIKQFSGKRYNADKLAAIERAMQRSGNINRHGVKAPRYYSANEAFIQHTEDGVSYMLMEFVPGHLESPETITERQMESLGEQCGAMHAHWRQANLQNVPFEVEGGREELERGYPNRLSEAESCGNVDLLRAVRKQRSILDSLGDEPFHAVPTGLAHCDFAVDNLLFDERGVTAIVDFDRNRHTYQWQDIGRAILSFAYHSQELRIPLIDAFIAGYRRHLPLTRSDIGTALALAWCIEANWWFRADVFSEEADPKVKRFAEELLWLTDHWEELAGMLQG